MGYGQLFICVAAWNTSVILNISIVSMRLRPQPIFDRCLAYIAYESQPSISHKVKLWSNKKTEAEYK